MFILGEMPIIAGPHEKRLNFESFLMFQAYFVRLNFLFKVSFRNSLHLSQLQETLFKKKQLSYFYSFCSPLHTDFFLIKLVIRQLDVFFS